MADLDTLKNLKIKKTTGEKTKTKKSVKSSTLSALTVLVEGLKSISFTQFIVGTIIVAQALAFYSLMTLYFQIVKDSYKEYSAVVKQFNDQKYQTLENRIKDLEDEIASQSAK